MQIAFTPGLTVAQSGLQIALAEVPAPPDNSRLSAIHFGAAEESGTPRYHGDSVIGYELSAPGLHQGTSLGLVGRKGRRVPVNYLKHWELDLVEMTCWIKVVNIFEHGGCVVTIHLADWIDCADQDIRKEIAAAQNSLSAAMNSLRQKRAETILPPAPA